jgi:hypothetical protein
MRKLTVECVEQRRDHFGIEVSPGFRFNDAARVHSAAGVSIRAI